MYVPLRAMVAPLEGEELVDGLQRFPIRRGDLHLPPFGSPCYCEGPKRS
jgi:hypothetical protein